MVMVRFITITTWDRIVDYRSIDCNLPGHDHGCTDHTPHKGSHICSRLVVEKKRGTDKRQTTGNRETINNT